MAYYTPPIGPPPPINPDCPDATNPNDCSTAPSGSDDGFNYLYIGVPLGVAGAAALIGAVIYVKRKRSRPSDDVEDGRQMKQLKGGDDDLNGAGSFLLAVISNGNSAGLESFLKEKEAAGTCSSLLERSLPGNDSTPLIYASDKGDEICVSVLLRHGAKVDGKNIDGETALFAAVRNEHEAVAKCLIEHRANVNARASDMSSPAHEAGSLDSPKMMKILKKAKCDINARDKTGCSPLIVAVKYGCIAVVKYLVSIKGLHINEGDEKGWSATHWSSSMGDTAMLEILVLAGARLNIRTVNGETPLFLACSEGHDVTVQFLLSKNVNRNLEDQYRRMAADAASAKGHYHIVQMLNDLGMPSAPALQIHDQPTIKEYLLKKGDTDAGLPTITDSPALSNRVT